MMLNKATKERIIESHLRFYSSYQIGITNCQKQLDYIMPSLVSNYLNDGAGNFFYIPNNTENVALDRIESKRAIDLKEEIERYKLILDSINNAFAELNDKEQLFVELRYFRRLEIDKVLEIMNYAEAKSLYRIRRQILDKFLISLKNLLSLK